MVPPNHPQHDTETDGMSAFEWYACERPESPHEADWTAYWSECDRCNIAFRAAAHMCPGEAVDLRTPADPYGKVALTFPTEQCTGM